jgi:hypothetical protein
MRISRAKSENTIANDSETIAAKMLMVRLAFEDDPGSIKSECSSKERMFVAFVLFLFDPGQSLVISFS